MKIAWFFPGQGSQFVGMGKDVLEASAAARRVFAESDDALGEPLSRLILEGPEERLTLTENAQPAIVTVSLAMLAALREKLANGSLPAPTFAAGHSLGEYSALVAAGALSQASAVRLVRARGRAMQAAVPPGVGAMAAIMGIDSRERVVALCAEASTPEARVQPANFNAPGQVVIAGHAEAVARAGELASKERGKAIPLKVSAPFHCSLMAPAGRTLASELERVTIASLAFPVVANVDAAPNQDPARVKELLVRQVDGAVRWEDSVRFMVAHGVTHALEIGPGKVLAGLCKRISKDLKVLSVGDIGSLAQVSAFLGG
jgi:[acyl-carrier-protein] S-malonyltransferase